MTLREAIIEARKTGQIRLTRDGNEALLDGRNNLVFRYGTEACCVDILATDWRVEKPPMDFATAMKHLQEGKKVRRRAWSPGYYAHRDVSTFGRHVTEMGVTGGNINATDWEVID